LAHARLVQSYPEPGEVVPMLSEIRLTFNEPIGQSSNLLLFTADFQAVPGVTSTVEEKLIRARFAAPLASGTYTVQWIAISGDEDVVQGTYSFEVSLGGWLMNQFVTLLPALIGIILLVLLWRAWRQRARRGPEHEQAESNSTLDQSEHL
jgi:methionine-rich copper-binding protein CopC